MIRIFRTVLICLAVLAPTAVMAQEHRRHDEFAHRHWHEGRWVHGMHDGRMGWWWVVGPGWYFYPAPVYPAPEPPAVVVQPAPPPVVVVPSAPPPPGYYYYCANPPGYYPTLPQCSMAWQLVPAAPQAVPQPAPVAPPPAPPPPPR